jgi:hypothetical protein
VIKDRRFEAGAFSVFNAFRPQLRGSAADDLAQLQTAFPA